MHAKRCTSPQVSKVSNRQRERYLPHKSSTKQLRPNTHVQSCSRDDGPTSVIPPTLTACCTAAPYASRPVAFSDPEHRHCSPPAAVVEAEFHVMPLPFPKTSHDILWESRHNTARTTRKSRSYVKAIDCTPSAHDAGAGSACLGPPQLAQEHQS